MLDLIFTTLYLDTLKIQSDSWWGALTVDQIKSDRSDSRYNYWRNLHAQVVDKVKPSRKKEDPEYDNKINKIMSDVRELVAQKASSADDLQQLQDIMAQDARDLAESDLLKVYGPYSCWLADFPKTKEFPQVANLPDLPNEWILSGLTEPSWYTPQHIEKMVELIEESPDSVAELWDRWEATQAHRKISLGKLYQYARHLAAPELIDNAEIAVEDAVEHSTDSRDPLWIRALVTIFQTLVRAEALSYWDSFLRDENALLIERYFPEAFTNKKCRYQHADLLEAYRELNARPTSILRLDRTLKGGEISASRFGGPAPIRVDEEWPLDKLGEPMEFIVAFNLIEAPYIPKFLEGFSVAVFYASVDLFATEQVENETFLIRLYSSHDELILKECEVDREHFWVGTPVECEWEEIAFDYPCCESPHLKLPEMLRDFPNEAHQYNMLRTKMGGYPSTIDSPLNLPEGYHFVIQVESESEASLMWGDSGSVYLCYNPTTQRWIAELQSY